MKYLSYIASCIILLSCNEYNNKNVIQNNIPDSDSIPNMYIPVEEQIKINVVFEPTLELTDEIKNTSLEALIREEKGQFTQNELKHNQRIYNDIYNRADERTRELLEDLSPRKANDMQLILFLGSITPDEILAKDMANKMSEFKSVPVSSNLAKVYYLQDMGEFIRNNEDYYNRIQNIIFEEKKQNKQKEKNWDKYLH